MTGCPVKAYEKDPVTGIVKHLDDQCIGCQYCMFMCPYDAPKFNPARGIVRKCDMCSDRLAHGEAPACVQACPNEAIRITVVDQRRGRSRPRRRTPSCPARPARPTRCRRPSTRRERALPRNLLPADFYSVNPEHAHPPLVAMLVLTQLSVGAFIVDLLAHAARGRRGARAARHRNALFALALGLAALGASMLAPRAARATPSAPSSGSAPRGSAARSSPSRSSPGWPPRSRPRTSCRCGLSCPLPVSTLRPLLGAAAAVGGSLGVVCSVMVYAATGAPHWRGAADRRSSSSARAARARRGDGWSSRSAGARTCRAGAAFVPAAPPLAGRRSCGGLKLARRSGRLPPPAAIGSHRSASARPC